MTFRLTPRAEADVETIARHIAEDSPAAALRWHDEIRRHCRNLGDRPGIGVARPDVRPDLRLLPAGDYLILYRQVEGVAEIIRVIHGARQWQELLRQAFLDGYPDQLAWQRAGTGRIARKRER